VQIRIRMGRGMFLLVFFFAISTLPSLLLAIPLSRQSTPNRYRTVRRKSGGRDRFYL
jgi:hypothetical protein